MTENDQKFLIVGIDPGAVTHGFAIYDPIQKVPAMYLETENALTLASIVTSLADMIQVVAIENFIGHGARDRYAIQTLRMLGFFEGICRFFGIPVTIQNPQMRKPFLRDAIGLVGEGFHFTDALAHAIACATLGIDGKGSTHANRNNIGTGFGETLSEVSANEIVKRVLQGSNKPGWENELLQELQPNKKS